MNINKAKFIDKNTTFYFDPPLERRMKQLNISDNEDINKIITLCPRLYINHLTFDLNIKSRSSDFEIKVTSLKTQKEYLKANKFKIITPYPNKRYLCAGTLINRKVKEGISFVPDDEDFSPFDDFINRVNCKEFNVIERSKSSLYDNIFVSKKDDDRKNNVDDYNEELKEKYEIARYKITECWKLKGRYEQYDELVSNGLEINYFIYVLRYKREYIQNIIYSKPILEVATASHSYQSNVKNTILGHVYQDKLTTSVNIYDNEDMIQEMILIPINHNDLEFFDYEEQIYKVNHRELSHKLISMVPIFE